jgi:DNA-binding response OmpR family regulator
MNATNNLPVVLVIEDHEDVRNYVKDTLDKNFTIIAAKDGEEGISKAIEYVPDLIVSDVMMPKKSGFDVCHILKLDEKTSHIPVILLTAKSDSEDKITGLMTKADDYVTKPFVPRELLVRIENLIELRKQLREKYKSEGVIRPKEVAVNSVDEKFLDKLIALVEINMGDEKFGVEQLGEELGMSRSQLHRKLKALLDQGPNQFIRFFRLQRAHDLLKQKAATASEIAYQVGFSSPSYFTKCFHEQFGYTPSEIPV